MTKSKLSRAIRDRIKELSIEAKNLEEVLGDNWEEKINKLDKRADIEEARDSLIDSINWEMPVIIENLDEEIDFTNETEFGQDVNENFKKYNGKRLIFRNCTNLKRIEVDCLSLIGLEIENCPQLEYLSAYNNEIEEIDLGYLENLKVVNLNCNKLWYIFLRDCENLQILHVSNNLLEKLNLNDNKNLRILYCSYNEGLESLKVKNLTELETLHCENCPLKSLNCAYLDKLKFFLYCFNSN